MKIGLRPPGAGSTGHAAPDVGSFRGFWLVLVALLLPGPAVGQFAVYPATVQWETVSGAGTEVLTVENMSAEATDVRVYLGDYDRAMDGAHDFVPFGEHTHSCGARLQAFPDQLSLAAGEKGEVRLRMEGGEGACWGVVFVEKRTPTPSGITVAQRIAVKVLAQTPGGVREGRVMGVAMDTAEARTAVVGFENTGNRSLDVAGEIEIRDLGGEILGVVPVESFDVLPGHRRAVWIPVDEVPLEPGRYLLVAVLDFGADYLTGGQTFMEVAQ